MIFKKQKILTSFLETLALADENFTKNKITRNKIMKRGGGGSGQNIIIIIISLI